jgi:hypothetical protein
MRGDRHVLEVTLLGDPTDERDRLLGGGLPATWGLHLADANLAMGNLEALAAAQDKLGFLIATVELALKREDLGDAFREYLRTHSLDD